MRRTRETFRPYREQLDPTYEQKIADCRKDYSAMLDKAQSNVIAPNFPMPHISINHDVLEQKAKVVKRPSRPLRRISWMYPSCLTRSYTSRSPDLSLATVANYMLLSDKLGRDWVGGSDTLTALLQRLLLIADGYISCHFIKFYHAQHVQESSQRICQTDRFYRRNTLIGSICVYGSPCQDRNRLKRDDKYHGHRKGGVTK